MNCEDTGGNASQARRLQFHLFILSARQGSDRGEEQGFTTYTISNLALDLVLRLTGEDVTGLLSSLLPSSFFLLFRPFVPWSLYHKTFRGELQHMMAYTLM